MNECRDQASPWTVLKRASQGQLMNECCEAHSRIALAAQVMAVQLNESDWAFKQSE